MACTGGIASLALLASAKLYIFAEPLRMWHHDPGNLAFNGSDYDVGGISWMWALSIVDVLTSVVLVLVEAITIWGHTAITI